MATCPQVYIDLNGVGEMFGLSATSDAIVLGSSVSLTETMKFFRKISREMPDKYGYCSVLADHIDLIANVPVRNVRFDSGQFL